MKKFKILKQFLLFISFVLQIALVNAQENQNGRVVTQGMLYNDKDNLEIEGTKFTTDNWVTGSAIASDHKIYKKLKLKFDALKGQFVYLDNNVMYELSDIISTVILYPNYPDTTNFITYKKNIIPEIKGYVQVLSEGKITFVKQWEKTITEYTEYGSAAKKQYSDVIKYKIIKNRTVSLVAMNKKNLLQLLDADKQTQTENFIQSKKINMKSEEGWSNVINYYNLL
jgi:hypothetical protein